MSQRQPPKVDGGKISRRDFLKLLAAAGTVMTFTPFVDWGKFLPNPKESSEERSKVVLPDGSQANVNTFKINHAEAVVYPLSEDPVLNEEAFRTWQFIRLPPELGGEKNDASAFRMFSMVCLHLWCLWKYWPEDGRKRGECPCHGTMYDPLTGEAFAGGATLSTGTICNDPSPIMSCSSAIIDFTSSGLPWKRLCAGLSCSVSTT